MRTFPLSLASLLLAPVAFSAPASKAPDATTPNGVIEERRVDGESAKFLAGAMKEAGIAKEPAPGKELGADHPRLEVAKDFVYRANGIACRADASACTPLKLGAAKTKRMLALFKSLGVKKTTPPKTPHAAKPYYYVEELICGAESANGAQPSCGVSAHFYPQKEK